MNGLGFEIIMVLLGLMLTATAMILPNMLGVGIVGLLLAGWFGLNIMNRFKRII